MHFTVKLVSDNETTKISRTRLNVLQHFVVENVFSRQCYILQGLTYVISYRVLHMLYPTESYICGQLNADV